MAIVSVNEAVNQSVVTLHPRLNNGISSGTGSGAFHSRRSGKRQ
jgi:hypothetical protein